VALLVHGRTWSSRPDFDLQVPGMQRSVLTSLAARGIAAYAVDLRGYGETPRDATGWNTPNRSAADVVSVLTWLAGKHPGLPKPALIGWSRGGGVAMLAAQTATSRVSSLTLFAFAYDPDAKFLDDKPPARPTRARNTEDAAISDFISPKVTPKAVVEAFVAQALRSDPITVDLKQDGELNALAPARLTVPTLVIYGDRDPGIIPAEAKKFVARLASADKQLVVLPGADHAAQLEDTHEQWVAAVTDFITKPRAR
jgi:pimeloyl-ACP methyl ester carboxylesterase